MDLLPTYNVLAFGAKADGRTINTVACQAAANACRENGGGTILISPGTFVTGIFRLFDHTTLCVEGGGRLMASPHFEDHRVGRSIGGLLYALDARGIRLTGEGVLDGNAEIFFSSEQILPQWPDFDYSRTAQAKLGTPYGSSEISHGPMLPSQRPGNMLVFARCTDLVIENLTITGATYWTTHCADCEDIVIRNVDIQNNVTHPNNDGIHLSTCRKVIVQGCHIVCGDDAIAITGFNHPAHEPEIELGFSGIVGVCEQIKVTDCSLSSRSSGVRIGYGKNPVRQVTLYNLDIVKSNRGIGIYARQAPVDDITVENCRIDTSLFHGNWWGRGEPIQISTVLFPGETEVFPIRNVTMRGIDATGENAITLFSEQTGKIDSIRMIGVRHTLRKGELFASWGGNLDLRPAANLQIAIHAGGTAPLWSIGVTSFEYVDCEWLVEPGLETIFSARPVIC